MTASRKDVFDQLEHIVVNLTGGSDALRAILIQDRLSFALPHVAAGDDRIFGLLVAEHACKIKSVKMVNGTDITQHATTYVDFALKKGDGAGGALSTLDTYSTDSAADGTISDNVPVSFTIDESTDTLAVGETLWLTYTHASTGTAVTPMNVTVVLEYTDA